MRPVRYTGTAKGIRIDCVVVRINIVKQMCWMKSKHPVKHRYMSYAANANTTYLGGGGQSPTRSIRPKRRKALGISLRGQPNFETMVTLEDST